MKCKYPNKSCPYRLRNGECAFKCPFTLIGDTRCPYVEGVQRAWNTGKYTEWKCKLGYVCTFDTLSYYSRCPYKDEMRKNLVIDHLIRQFYKHSLDDSTKIMKHILLTIGRICNNNIECMAEYLDEIMQGYAILYTHNLT